MGAVPGGFWGSRSLIAIAISALVTNLVRGAASAY